MGAQVDPLSVHELLAKMCCMLRHYRSLESELQGTQISYLLLR